MAIAMLEAAVASIWTLDVEAARTVRLSDDRIDSEEVAIEQECFQIMALRAPFAREFRVVTFVLRVNSDVERVADHACSIAKSVVKISEALEAQSGTKPNPPAWPTALVELAQRVPAMCHELMRAVLDENADLARELVASDQTIDRLEKRLFDEIKELMKVRSPREDSELSAGLLIYRMGRELERVGDLMASIAEDVVYLTSGSIIRHEKRKSRNQTTDPTA
jgi:phosphate transport system protein